MSQDQSPTSFPVQTVRGVKDVLPQDSPRWQRLEAVCRDLFARYGFGEIRTPIFEVTGLFLRSIGAATDIVEKEMYTFDDRSGHSLTLRPEGTAGVMRAYIQHELQRDQLCRLYYSGPMFRYERPQAGRLRQFHQIGAEALGPAVPSMDVEVLSLLADLFAELGIDNVQLEINSIGCPDCRPAYTAMLKQRFAAIADGLCGNCQRRRDSNPLRVLDCKVESCGELTRDTPAITDHLCQVCQTHMAGVESGLNALEIAYTVNPRMVRGLDYYSRTAFEWVTTALGAQNTVAAGGRYDGLNEQLGGISRAGIGFALGVERLLTLMGEVLPPRPDIYAALLGEAAETRMLPVVRALRAAGLSVDRAFGGGSLKSQLKRANRSGARFCLIVGEDELAQNVVMVKDMREGDQREVALDDLVARMVEATG